ncbi:MAG TPA: ABC transporter substrate-binding protein [Pseudolabrys sp.]|nr:ABC transporter substrate-binding protein [Pseudolabrys sp.]
MKRFIITAGVVLLLAPFATHPALAQSKTITIGVLEDQSGVYADATGAGSVLATQMAVEDSGLEKKGWKINVISADHQNKADLAANIARKWFDVEKADVIVGLGNSSVALAVHQIARDMNKVAVVTSGATSDLTGKACSPNTVHWTYDTYALAKSTGTAMTKNAGDTWFFIAADYAFGAALQRDTTAAVEKAGGKVLGGVRHPLNSSDFSSYLLQAQTSGAKVVGFANAGADATNSIKQAAEFGMAKSKQKLAALLMFLPDVRALGLPVAQGLNLTETFYWDLNEATRAFSGRFAARMKNGAVPTMPQAGTYAGTLHYLKAAAALNGDVADGAKVVAKMKEIPKDDPLFGKGRIRVDGRAIHPVYLFQVKSPAESKGPWDLYKLVATVPGDEGFRPLAEGGCPLVK